MSLLDDVSIVVTPNGYKAGELYAVVPVPTEGSEEGSNMDFSSGTSPWALNSNWSLGGVGVIADGTSNGTIWQNAVVEDNKQYIVTYTLTDFLQGTLKISLSGNDGVSRDIAGTYTEILTSGTSPTTRLTFEGGGNFKVTLSNVIVKEYTSADMDVTRETAATRVDEDGLVNYALGVEEVTNGDFASDTDWTKGTGWTISGGNLNASNVNAASTTQAGYTFVGKTFQVSYTISDYSQGGVRIYLGGSQPTSLKSANGTHTETISISSGNTLVYIYGKNNFTGNIDNVSIKEVNNVPRIDYTGGGCPHILAEPMRTNLIPYSEDFTDTYWTSSTDVETPVKSTTIKSPDGNYNAWHIVKDGSNSKVAKVVGSSSVEYSKSIWARTISGSGTAYFGNGSPSSGVLTTVTTEWQRIEITSSVINFYAVDFRGSSTLTEVLIWGAQMEEGSYTTSYIPTSGSTVTRNQDIFTRDGIGSLINSTEGVLFVEFYAESDSTEKWISLSDGTATNRVIVYIPASNTLRIYVQNSSGGQADLGTSITLGQFNKVAFKYKENDFSLYLNGVEVASDNSGGVPVGLDRLNFSAESGTYNFFNGKVRQLQVYKTALTDEQLLQLTGESGTDFYESYAEMAAALTYTIQ